MYHKNINTLPHYILSPLYHIVLLVQRLLALVGGARNASRARGSRPCDRSEHSSSSTHQRGPIRYGLSGWSWDMTKIETEVF